MHPEQEREDDWNKRRHVTVFATFCAYTSIPCIQIRGTFDRFKMAKIVRQVGSQIKCETPGRERQPLFYWMHDNHPCYTADDCKVVVDMVFEGNQLSSW